MRLLAFILIALAVAAPTEAKRTVADVEELVSSAAGVEVRCTATWAERGYLGWFDWRESDPPVIELDRGRVCGPIVRKWRRGYPRATGEPLGKWGRHALGAAIFVAAHETRHAQQWRTGGAESLDETDADEHAARKFRWWARNIAGVTNRSRQRELALLISPWIGYESPMEAWAWAKR